MTKITVVLVDDHALVRLGLKTLINDQTDMGVIGEAGTAQEALDVVERHRPQVVLMDIRLPGKGGNEEVLRGIRSAVQGNSVLDASTTTRLFARVRASGRKEEEDAFRDLTEREMAVLHEVEQGKTNAEVAQSLNLSEKTARNYVSTLLEKLQMSNRIELATYAVKYHLSERMKHE